MTTDEALDKARRAIVDIIISLEDRPRVFDVSNADSRNLIVWDRTLFFYNADAVIRLLGVKEPVKDWWIAYDNAAIFAGQVDIDILVKLYVQTGDSRGVTGLTILRLDRDETKNEINRRMREVPTARNFLKFIDSESQEDADNLTAHARNLYNKWARQKGAPQAPRIEKGLPVEKRESGDIDQHILTEYYAFYSMFKQDVSEWGNVEYSRSPLAHSRPLIPWDEAAPGIWKDQANEVLSYLEPVLKEDARRSWQKMPTRSLSGFLKKSRKAKKTEPIYKPDPDNPEEQYERTDIKHEDSHEDKALFTAMLEDRIRRILEAEGSRKPEKILNAFRLVLGGLTLIDAAKEAGISYASAKKFLSILKKEMKSTPYI